MKKIDWDEVMKAVGGADEIFTTNDILTMAEIVDDTRQSKTRVTTYLRSRRDLECVYHRGEYYFKKPLDRPITKATFLKLLNKDDLDVLAAREPIDIIDGPSYAVLQVGQFPSDFSWDTYDDPDSAYQKFVHAIANELTKTYESQDEFFLLKIQKHTKISFTKE